MTPVESPQGGDSTDPFIGRTLGGKFRIISELARGGMGKIYYAEQVPLGRPVALKVLRSRYTDEDAASNETFRKRFLLEASILAKVQHANVVTLYDYGRIEEAESDQFFMAMEFLRGDTLAQRLSVKGSFSALETIHLARQIARGLREAHKLGVVHRDLKPANIMLDVDDDGGEIVKILDFGIGKLVRADSEELTQEGVFVGSPRYMSPEQVLNDRNVDAGADLYALGVIMYECLVGKGPFVGDSAMTLLMAHCEKPVPRMRDRNADAMVPETLEALVRQMLEKDPANRPASADAVIRALKVIERDLSGDTGNAGRSGSHPALDLAGESDPALERRAAIATSGVADLDDSAARRFGAERPSWLIPLLAVTVVGAVIATVTVTGLLRNKGEATVASISAPAALPPAAEPPTFQLAIASTPPGAEVLEGDAVFGTTPLRIPVERASVKKGARKFTVRLAGYGPYTFYQQDSPKDVDVLASLTPLAPAASSAAPALPSASSTGAKPAPAPVHVKPAAVAASTTPAPAPNPDLQIKTTR